MSEQTFLCNRCSAEHSMECCHNFDDENLCPTCLEEETILCDRCGDRIWRESDRGDQSRALCEDCYYDYYTRCTTCRALIHNDDAYYRDEDEDIPFCYHCYEETAKRGMIHSYNYKPEPVFYGNGGRFFGVELEIDCAGEDAEYAQEILASANKTEKHLYCKHDGSLNDGFELVSHPMTLEYHQETMPWEDIMEVALRLGYLSHKAKTCGLHIHVNRSSFGNSTIEQESAIARVLYFVENHWLELLRFSRRTEYQLSQWAARYGRKDSPKAVLDAAKDSYARYTCVNLTNYATIEFRIFRGTLKYNTFIATLQLVDEICKVAISLSDEDLDKLSWTDFVESLDVDARPELVQYLKERRLYVNELVLVGEEV